MSSIPFSVAGPPTLAERPWYFLPRIEEFYPESLIGGARRTLPVGWGGVELKKSRGDLVIRFR